MSSLQINRVLQIQDDPYALLSQEWLVTNGLGGYASGTISGAVTRRYHGFLTASLPAPLGRIVMLNHLSEQVIRSDGMRIDLTAEEYSGRRLHMPGSQYLKEFRLEMGLPIWRYDIDGVILEKRVLMPYGQNTAHITYELIEGDLLQLELRPSIHFRPQEATVEREFAKDYTLVVKDDLFEIHGGDPYPPVRLCICGEHAIFIMDRRKHSDIHFRVEEARGYPHTGHHWSPGAFALTMVKGKPSTLIASTESLEVIRSKLPQEAKEVEIRRRQVLLQSASPVLQNGMGAELVLAADQFIITPAGRPDESVSAKASGSDARTIIAGYHWFTDWGRDTMISLEGLTLATGRQQEAGYILRTFANHVRDGLIPNMFPEHDKTGVYHTADATLWFFHALHRYVSATQDRETLRAILPKLIDIVEHHLRGTQFNIGIDPADGLLKQGAEGYQLTWMDAKVNGWVVTPRRGKAVELNALWYNAVRLLVTWIRQEDGEHATAWLQEIAEQAYDSFNTRFWYAKGGYLYDVVDGETGDDTACRPNQLLAISLDHEVLQKDKWQAVFETAKRELLTPYGLRSLSKDHPDYKLAYVGDLMARDAAYHQGTVWGWLIGIYIDSWLKVQPDAGPQAQQLLMGFDQHLNEAGIGTISEVFDAESPYTPGGCIAQAWSVGEVLRCLAKTAFPPTLIQ